MNWKKINPYFWIITLALVLRVWGYDKNPVGLVHDEIHQLVNAKSLLLTGKEAAGTGAGVFNNNPYCEGNCVFGELPSYLLVPFALLPTNFPWLKLPFIILSLAMVYLGGKFFENLTGNKKIGMLVGLVTAINPWSVNFGRTAYENLFSFMFYFWSLYLWTKKPVKLTNKIGAIVTGLAASLCYFGAKPIFVPIMLLGLGYSWFEEKKNIRKYLILGMVVVILMAGYGLILKNSYAGVRLKETNLINREVVEQVNEERRMSLEIPIFRDVFINKYTVLAKILIKKYFAVLAPNYLFNEGELGYDHFMIANHPFLYLIDLPLILLGLYFLAVNNARALVLIGGLLFVLPITPTLSNFASTYALRAGLVFPILAGVSGVGIYELNKLLGNKKRWMVGLVFLGYLVSIINFLVMYWFRTPFEKSAGWVFFERETARYISLVQDINKTTKIELTTKDPVDVIYEYALFTGKINNKIFVEEMNRAITSRTYMVNGIKFSKLCPTEIDDKTVYLWEREQGCVKEPNRLARISEPRDGGARYFIPNEQLCEGVTLGAYPFPRKVEDFMIEKMDRNEFCQKWISKP
ncbi:MAG: hypothetical protein WCV93_00700 [Candidatus Shapirobacteria bacterium]